ncbi:hypothetical protein IBX38_04780 [Candidatus Bathyarchaeota archaeon]|nr:hypothetical protein [Candidatus Bathyarchaeota archaeon]
MRYAVRALGWATKILWILIIVFSVASVYSAMNVRMGFGQPQAFLSSGFMVISVPLFVNNTGLYDLSELNMTVAVMDYNESLLSTSTTFVPSIPRGSSIETAHNVSVNLDDITSKLLNYLFNDTVFNLDMSLKINFAHSIPFEVSTNMTMPWGAPLYNFSIGQISYNFLNLTHQEAIIPISFENHSPYFSVDGFMQVEIYNDNDELLGFSVSDLNVPSHSSYDSQVEIVVDVSKITGSGEVRFYFETSAFSFGPVVMSYG